MQLFNKLKLLVLTIAILSISTLSAKDNKVNSYWTSSLTNVEEIKSNLSSNGFTVLAEYSIAENNNLKSIIITNDELKKVASKKRRGFAAILRVLINKDKKIVKIQNPEYFLKAYLQKDYSKEVAESVQEKLIAVFGKMDKTDDELNEKDLKGYHFMFAMPYYKDVIKLSKGSSKELLSKYESQVKDNHLFKIELGNDTYLLGVKMPKEVESFVNTIGTDNAVLLPYTILIEGGVAKALHAKFYIALSYPRLTMGEFMKIMSTPGKIEDALSVYFE